MDRGLGERLAGRLVGSCLLPILESNGLVAMKLAKVLEAGALLEEGYGRGDLINCARRHALGLLQIGQIFPLHTLVVWVVLTHRVETPPASDHSEGARAYLL